MKTHTNEYLDLCITPKIVEALILELFAGEVVRLSEIAPIVRQEFIDRGGNDPGECIPHNRFYSSMKKGLRYLKNGEYAELVPHNRWRIKANRITTDIPVQNGSQQPIVESNENTSMTETLTIGSGIGAVYVYYYPTYKEMANIKSESAWRCKIGYSEKSTEIRIKGQSATTVPEKEEIGLVIRTDYPNLLEHAIQFVLKCRGRWEKESPGKEWFLTSPTEVAGIYTIINSI